jgi:hypothetical protein
VLVLLLVLVLGQKNFEDEDEKEDEDDLSSPHCNLTPPLTGSGGFAIFKPSVP